MLIQVIYLLKFKSVLADELVLEYDKSKYVVYKNAETSNKEEEEEKKSELKNENG